MHCYTGKNREKQEAETGLEKNIYIKKKGSEAPSAGLL